MKTRAFLFFAVAAALLIASAPVFAHHGASAYDSKKLTTLKGTVTDFQFMNPHSEIFFEVKNADGKVDKWSAEAASMVTMSRLEIAREMVRIPCVSAKSYWPTAKSMGCSAVRITRINRGRKIQR